MADQRDNKDNDRASWVFEQHGSTPIRSILQSSPSVSPGTPSAETAAHNEPLLFPWSKGRDAIQSAVAPIKKRSQEAADGTKKVIDAVISSVAPKSSPDSSLPTSSVIDSEDESEWTEIQVSQSNVENTKKTALDSFAKETQKAFQDAGKTLDKAFRNVTNPVQKGSQKVWEGTKQAAVETGKTVNSAVRTIADPIQKTTKKVFATKSKSTEPVEEEDDDDDVAKEPALPPDETLKSMDIIISKTLKRVSVQDWYEICWSEGNRTDKSPFYGPWLEDTGKKEVYVGEWSFCDEGESFKGDWDNEDYQQKRTVTFQKNAAGFYPGVSVANVTHTQCCRYDNDRAVISMKVEMEGIPFADAFHVQLRWVATRLGKYDLQLELGLYVVFVKQVIVAGKIRSGTTENTREAQFDLFHRMKVACCAGGGPEEEDELESMAEEGAEMMACLQKPTELLSMCFPFLQPKAVEGDDIDLEIRNIREMLQTIISLPSNEQTTSADGRMYVKGELDSCHDAVDRILFKFIGSHEEAEEQDAAAGSSSQEETADFLNAIADPFRKAWSATFDGGDDAKSLRKRLLGNKQRRSASTKSMRQSLAIDPNAFSPVVADDKLESMSLIIDKSIVDATVEDFYGVCWSEEPKPFYGPWLESVGRSNVVVGDWTSSDGAELFVSDFSGDKFTHFRKINYHMKMESTIGQRSGTAAVEQTQYCRLEEVKFVWETTSTVSGVPFSDAFKVHLRGVATQSMEGGLSVKVGIFVVFTKKTMLAPKIRAAVTRDATKQNVNFVRKARDLLKAGPSEQINAALSSLDKDSDEKKPLRFFKLPLDDCMGNVQKLSHMHLESMLDDDAELAKAIRSLNTKIKAVETFVRDEREEADETEMMNFVVNQLELIGESLDNVILWHGNKAQGQEALMHASFT